MNQHNPIDRYRKTNIATASPAQLLLMLYDAAIASMNTAIAELEKRSLRYDIVNNNLIKAQEIIGELLSTLDFKKSPEIARNLESLYHYFMRRLMEGNLRKDIFTIEEVNNHMIELRNAWEVAVQNVNNEQGNALKENKTVKPVFNHKNEPNKGGFNIKG